MRQVGLMIMFVSVSSLRIMRSIYDPNSIVFSGSVMFLMLLIIGVPLVDSSLSLFVVVLRLLFRRLLRRPVDDRRHHPDPEKNLCCSLFFVRATGWFMCAVLCVL